MLRDRIFLFIVILILLGIEWLDYNISKNSAILAALILIVGGYMLYLPITKLRYIERRTPYAPNYRPFVSIIIPAKNEAKVIEATIREVMKIVYHKSDGTPNYELIVANDGSTDETPEILDRLSKEYTNLKPYHRKPVKRSSKAAVLNEVTPMCKGEVICVFDADSRVKPNFLERIIPYLSDEKVAAVQAQKRISNPNYNNLTAAQDDELFMLMAIGEGQDLAEGAVDLRGNGMLIKKEVLLSVGGWTEDALTEDLDMSTKLHTSNWLIRYCPEISIYEEATTTIKAFLKQRRRWIEGALRRYLTYFTKIIGNNVSLIKKVDMFSFFFTFIFPLWFFIDVIYMTYYILSGGTFRISMVMYMLIVLFVIGIIQSVVGLKRAEVHGKRKILLRSLRNVIYTFHWFPVVIFVSFKIIFSLKPSEWDKTDHTGVGVE